MNVTFHRTSNNMLRAAIGQVTVQVAIPTRLSKEEKKLIEELAAISEKAPGGSGKGWL
jgi:DnaJ-class molecular chaperone